MTKCMGVILAFCAGAGALSAQETLAWKFRAGETFVLERVYAQKQIIDVKGKQLKQESATTWLNKFVVKEAREMETLLETTIVSVVQKQTGKGAAGEDKGLLEKLAGTQLVVALSPAGRVLRLDGYQDLLKKLAGNNAEREKALKFLLPEAGLRDGLEEVFGFLPDQPVKFGAVWQRRAVEPMPPFGSFQTYFEYRYKGKKADVVLLDCKLKMIYELPDRDHPLFQVTKGKLQADSGKGQIRFDLTKGRLLSGTRSVAIKGQLTVEALGNQTVLDFSSDNNLTWRLLPDAEEKKDKSKTD